MSNYQNECFRCGAKITKLDPSLDDAKELGFNDYLCSYCHYQGTEQGAKS